MSHVIIFIVIVLCGVIEKTLQIVCMDIYILNKRVYKQNICTDKLAVCLYVQQINGFFFW